MLADLTIPLRSSCNQRGPILGLADGHIALPPFAAKRLLAGRGMGMEGRSNADPRTAR